MLSIISRRATGEPDISRPTSKPLRPSSCIAAATESPFVGFTQRVAPIFLAMSRRYSLRSVTTMFLAPANLQMAVAIVPIRPAPVMRTSSPRSGKERAVWVAFPNGSMMAMKSSGMRESTFTTLDAGRLRYSANAPSRFTPTPMEFSQMCSRPLRQLRQ